MRLLWVVAVLWACVVEQCYGYRAIDQGKILTSLYCLRGPWLNDHHWACGNTTVDPCKDQWEGVECNEMQEVVKLTIVGNEDTQFGTLPRVVGNISTMTHLVMRNVGMKGPIPSFLGRLVNLTHIDLSQNDLVGLAVPPFLGLLQRLKYYNISGNEHLRIRRSPRQVAPCIPRVVGLMLGRGKKKLDSPPAVMDLGPVLNATRLCKMRTRCEKWVERQLKDKYWPEWIDRLPRCPCSLILSNITALPLESPLEKFENTSAKGGPIKRFSQWRQARRERKAARRRAKLGVWPLEVEPVDLWRPVRVPVKKLHPGAEWEVRTWPDPLTGAGQQCTYDAYGTLITEGVAVPGTPDRRAPSKMIGMTQHARQDVLPFFFCDWETYTVFRPPDRGEHCKRPGEEQEEGWEEEKEEEDGDLNEQDDPCRSMGDWCEEVAEAFGVNVEEVEDSVRDASVDEEG